MTSEGLGLLGSSRGSLDGRAVRELQDVDTLGEELADWPAFTNGRDARRTQRDWAGSGRSNDKAVDLVLDDFESAGLEDALLELVAAGRGC